MFHQAVRDLWAGCKSSLVLSILIPVLYAYTTDKAPLGTGLDRDSIQKVTEVE